MVVKIIILLLAAIPYILVTDPSSSIIRPCKFYDYKCIGSILAAGGSCKLPVKGKLPNKYTVGSFHFETQFFNASYVDNGLIVRNHDKCYVSEFFVNLKTLKVVLTINCPFLDVESDRTYIQHWTAREDGVFLFHIRSTYPLLRITINFPANMNLCSASIFTEVTYLPIMHINPKNLPTKKQLTRDLTHLYIYERECCFFRGPPIAFMFIDAIICDFGCRIPN